MQHHVTIYDGDDASEILRLASIDHPLGHRSIFHTTLASSFAANHFRSLTHDVRYMLDETADASPGRASSDQPACASRLALHQITN